jgi:hypothetical protein
MSDVPKWYKATQALLLPTLLESFSGTYIEAMHFERPIFTSNLDFAKEVCENRCGLHAGVCDLHRGTEGIQPECKVFGGAIMSLAKSSGNNEDAWGRHKLSWLGVACC